MTKVTELQLAISSNEVLNYQREYRKYICDFPSVRQSELAWITDRIEGMLSAATSQKGGWAVSDTIKPAIIRGLSTFNLSDQPAKFLREMELAARAS